MTVWRAPYTRAARTSSCSLSVADSSGSGIGRGCTLDPFTKTMRCVDFDNCKTHKNGKKTCPVVVTPYGMSSTGRGSQSNTPQLFESANATFVSRF